MIIAHDNAHDGSYYGYDIQGRCRACGYQMTDADMQVYEEADIAMMREYESWPEEMKIHCEVVPFDAPPGYIVTCS